MAAKYAYIGKAECGCIRAVVVDEPRDRYTTARQTASWVRAGLVVSRVTVKTVRATRLTRPECEVHNPVRQEALL